MAISSPHGPPQRQWQVGPLARMRQSAMVDSMSVFIAERERKRGILMTCMTVHVSHMKEQLCI